MFDYIPLQPRAKRPRDEEWTTRSYTAEEIEAWRAGGGNVGIRMRPGELVVDIDPRNDPEKRTAAEILHDFELDFGISLSCAPIAETGSGGLHVFLTGAEADHLEHIRDYSRAVEFKGHGRQVVAAGSIHPNGQPYRWLREGAPAPAPKPLLDAIQRPAAASAGAPSQTISPEHLRRFLAQIPVEQFSGPGMRSEWLKVMLECHAATGGEGFDVFAEWSAGAEDYAADRDDWAYQWDRLRSDRSTDRGLASLAWRVQQNGGQIPSPPADEDFEALSLEESKLFVWLEPFNRSELPRRSWALTGLLLDGQVTLLVARGGTCKSLFALQIAAMCCTGTEWAYWTADKPRKVLIVNAEDDIAEQRRRLAVAEDAMFIQTGSLVGLLAQIGLDGEKPRDLALVRRRKMSDPVKRTEFYKELKAQLIAEEFGLLIVDPLIEMQSGLDENSNTDMKELATALRDLARECKIPVLAVHHAKKGAAAGDQEGSRGGSALMGAARVSITLTAMSEQEAERFLPADKREDFWRYIKFSPAKQNYGSGGGPKWFEVISERVGNAEDGGDWAPALRPWDPNAGGAFAQEAIDSVLIELENKPYRLTNKGAAGSRAGPVVAKLLDCTIQRAETQLKEWITAGLLVERDGSLYITETESKKLAQRKFARSEPITEDADL